MKIAAKDLKVALSYLSSTVPKQSTMDSSTCFRFEGDGSECVISATNGERLMRYTIPCTGSLTTLVPRDKIVPLASLVVGDIELGVRERTLRVTAGKNRFDYNLPSRLDLDQYPFEMPTTFFRVATQDLRAIAIRTRTTCEAQSTRYALGGAIVLPAGDNEIRFCSTDTYRSSSATATLLDCEANVAELATIRPIISLSTLDVLSAKFSDSDEAEIGFAGTSVVVRSGNLFLAARLLSGRYPAIEAYFPAHNPVLEVTAEPGELIRLLEMIDTASSSETNAVALTVGDNEVQLELVDNTASGEVSLTVDADFAPQTAHVDRRFLKEAILAVNKVSEVKLGLTRNNESVTIRTSDGYHAFIMSYHT